jgi:hypothetical protein
MEISLHPRPTRGMHANDFGARRGRNKQWVAPGAEQSSRSASSTPGPSDAEGRDRGRGRGQGRGQPPRINGVHSQTTSRTGTPAMPPTESTTPAPVLEEPVLETQEEREKFYQEVCVSLESYSVSTY